MEGTTFVEAIESLAESAGVEIDREDSNPQELAEQRRTKEMYERLFYANECACEFFEKQLAEHKLAYVAVNELQQRGVSEEISKSFRLGYAPAEWSALNEYLVHKGVSPADAEMAGLVYFRKNSAADKFRHRLMFPVFDRSGKIIAFSGRILDNVDGIDSGIIPENPGKYINSPETPIYRKGESLFGLQVARAAMAKDATAIVVEGNFDVVVMHQHGFSNTVCALGTAFTEQQARLLRRFAESATVMFDADAAGQKATRSTFGVFEKIGISGFVATLGSGDPDEYLRTHGASAMSGVLAQAKGYIEWMLLDIDVVDNASQRAKAVSDAAGIIAMSTNRTEADTYISLAARKLMVPRESIEKAVYAARRHKVPAAQQESTDDTFELHGAHFELASGLMAVPEMLSDSNVIDAISVIDNKDAAKFISIMDGTQSDLAEFLSNCNPLVASWVSKEICRIEAGDYVESRERLRVTAAAKKLLLNKNQREIESLRQSAKQAELSGNKSLAIQLHNKAIKMASAMRK